MRCDGTDAAGNSWGANEELPWHLFAFNIQAMPRAAHTKLRSSRLGGRQKWVLAVAGALGVWVAQPTKAPTAGAIIQLASFLLHVNKSVIMLHAHVAGAQAATDFSTAIQLLVPKPFYAHIFG